MALGSSNNSPARGDTGSKIGKTGSEVLNSLLDRLDAIDDSAVRNRRSTQRIVYRKLDVPVRVFHPGGSTSIKAVPTRNLSAMGLGFLYTSFLHNGTIIEVTLRRRLGGEDVVRGKVVFCGHIAGVFHQIGVKFDQKIFPKLYLDPGTYDEIDAEGQTDTAKLEGNVLYIDDQEMDRILLKHQLKTTKVQLTAVATAAEGLAALAKTTFKLVLCDLNLEIGTGEDAIKAIRTSGYTGPICLVTAETTPSRLKQASEAGASGVLAKPYEQQRLLAILNSFLGGVNSAEAIYSTLHNPDVKEMLLKYIDTVHAAGVELANLSSDDYLEKVRQQCMGLKGTGTGYGFGVLSEAAKEAVKSLDATMSVTESGVQLQRLIDICRRVTVAK
jgi:CheY-like chemotaxis protein